MQALDSTPETSKECGLREEPEKEKDTVSRLGEKLLTFSKEISRCREVIRDLEEQLKRKRKLCKEFVAKNSRKPVKTEKNWLMGQRFDDEEEEEEYSGDEDE